MLASPVAPPPEPTPRDALHRWGPALLALAALALYAPALRNGLTNWDDLEYVTTSPFATKGLAGLPLAWTQPLDHAWYPLTHSLYCLVYAAVGEAPFAYHALQVLLFALACALAPLALEGFGLPRRLGALATACWLLHPLRVESVAWVANLKDTLSLALVLAAFALLPRSRWASAAAFSGALLAKSTVFPLALTLATLDALRRPAGRLGTLGGSLRWVLPACATAVVAARLHLPTSEAFHRTHPGGSLLAAVPTALTLPWRYAWTALTPHQPRALYDLEPLAWTSPPVLGALLAWAALAWLVARSPRPWSAAAAASAFALPFLPVTGLVPLVFHVADRYALLPSLAVDAAVVLAVAHLAARLRLPRALAALPVALSLALVPATLVREAQWRSAVTLWEADRGQSHHLAARINLAGAYGGEGRFGEAAAELAGAVEQAPNDVVVLSHLVFALAARDGAPPDAVVAWVNAVRASRGDRKRLLAVAQAARQGGVPAVADALERWRGATPGR